MESMKPVVSPPPPPPPPMIIPKFTINIKHIAFEHLLKHTCYSKKGAGNMIGPSNLNQPVLRYVSHGLNLAYSPPESHLPPICVLQLASSAPQSIIYLPALYVLSITRRGEGKMLIRYLFGTVRHNTYSTHLFPLPVLSSSSTHFFFFFIFFFFGFYIFI